MYERQLLRELEALRTDIDGVAKKVVPAANGVPKPTIIPPLEDYSERPSHTPPPSAPTSNGFHREQPSQIQPPHTAAIPRGPGSGFTPHKIPNVPVNSFYPQSPALSPLPQTPGPELVAASPSPGPLSPAPRPTLQRHPSLPPPQLPSAGPSNPTTPYSPIPRQATEVPPLGGRFVDGTKSMFVTRATSSPRPSPLAASASVHSIPGPSASGPMDPLRNASYPVASTSLHDPLNEGPSPQQYRTQDPLISIKPHQMSSSMRVQPSRPRLDAREAASKLANMF